MFRYLKNKIIMKAVTARDDLIQEQSEMIVLLNERLQDAEGECAAATAQINELLSHLDFITQSVVKAQGGGGNQNGW